MLNENGTMAEGLAAQPMRSPLVDTLGTQIHATSYEAATEQILWWARAGESKSVYAANVHMVMEAYDQNQFRQVLNDSDMVTPDGMPLVWSLRLAGMKNATRVYGPDLTQYVLRAAEKAAVPVGFYGGSPMVLKQLLNYVTKNYPTLPVVFAESPPFRVLTPEEDERATKRITESGLRILFVGLGCPKQERWIAEHRGSIQGVMMGVGAAFDFLSGHKAQAPRWMMACGLEWLFRLGCEPGRLWKRYTKHNLRFVILMGLQLMRGNQTPRTPISVP